MEPAVHMAVLGVEPVQLAEQVLAVELASAHAASLAAAVARAR